MRSDSPTFSRDGVFVEARGQIHWLEWSAPDDADLDDYELAARVNPAPRFTPTVLARSTRSGYRNSPTQQFHLNMAGITEAAWLPVGSWQACRGPVDLTPRELFVGIDIGGTRSASALVGVTDDARSPDLRSLRRRRRRARRHRRATPTPRRRLDNQQKSHMTRGAIRPKPCASSVSTASRWSRSRKATHV